MWCVGLVCGIRPSVGLWLVFLSVSVCGCVSSVSVYVCECGCEGTVHFVPYEYASWLSTAGVCM